MILVLIIFLIYLIGKFFNVNKLVGKCEPKYKGGSSYMINYKKIAISQYNKYDKCIKMTNELKDKIIANHKGLPGLILGYEIIDNNIKEDSYLNNVMMQNNIETSKTDNIVKDDRSELVLQMLNKAMNYGSVPNTYVLIFISDHNIWNIPNKPHMNDIMNLPIFCFAKEEGDKNPVFPDVTFERFDFDEKYGNTNRLNWKDSIELINKNIYDEEKQALIYFKGAMTGQYSYNLRNKLFNYNSSLDSEYMKLEKLQKGDYTPIYEWSRYKYLLNLPGHYPWSNRKKYLFLLESPIIDINVDVKCYDNNHQLMSFIDLIISKEKYINYTYHYESINGKEKNENQQIQKLYDFINNTVNKLEKNKSYYNKYHNRAKSIKNTLLSLDPYEYIYECLVQNAKYIN
jgi:hypothetical protein